MSGRCLPTPSCTRGDIGDLAVLDELAVIAPVFAVRGNIDVRAPNLPDHLMLYVVAGDASLLRILLMHIAVNGPRLRADAGRLARSRDVSLVVCGHSHVPVLATNSVRGRIARNLGLTSLGSRSLREDLHPSCRHSPRRDR